MGSETVHFVSAIKVFPRELPDGSQKEYPEIRS